MALVTKNVPEHNNRSQVMAVGVGPAQSNTGWFVQMQLSAFKRTLAMGAVWTVAMGGLLATSPAASGQEAVEPGLGNAYAQGVKIDPRTGQLSIGLTYGMSLAGHQNKVAIAEARSLDLGIIGTLLAGEGCDGGDPTLPAEQQPQPLVVRSGEDGADKGRSETELGVDKEALANDGPLARAVATAGAIGEPAAMQIAGAKSTTESGIIDGARVARAVSEIGRVSFGGGALVLRGLRWEARYQTAPTEEHSGSFSIDGIEVAGETIPLPDDNPLASLAEANALLEPLGIRISPPTVRADAGIQFVDPLRISVVPSETRESILGPIFNAIQPVREELFAAIMDIDCGNATYLTVLDIVLGSVSGAGSANIELGGVTATSDDIEFTSFLGGLGEAPALPPLSSGDASSPSLSGGGSSPSLSGGSSAPAGAAATTPPTTVASAPASDTGGGGEQAAIADVEPLSGSRGGALAGVGLGGLALLAALAAADRAQMRRAQRSILMEVSS